MPQHAINVPATEKNCNGGSFPAIADTLPDAKGSVSATYAKGYTTMYLAFLMILLRETANASFLGLMIVVVVSAPLLLISLYVALLGEAVGRLADVWNMLELPMCRRRKKKIEM
jgi:hypothetical protein